MNNKNILYIIIAILVILNVATLSIFWSRQFFNPFSMMVGFGSNGMMGHSSDDHDHSTNDFNTWEEMLQHMEEGHGEEVTK